MWGDALGRFRETFRCHDVDDQEQIHRAKLQYQNFCIKKQKMGVETEMPNLVDVGAQPSYVPIYGQPWNGIGEGENDTHWGNTSNESEEEEEGIVEEDLQNRKTMTMAEAKSGLQKNDLVSQHRAGQQKEAQQNTEVGSSREDPRNTEAVSKEEETQISRTRVVINKEAQQNMEEGSSHDEPQNTEVVSKKEAQQNREEGSSHEEPQNTKAVRKQEETQRCPTRYISLRDASEPFLVVLTVA